MSEKLKQDQIAHVNTVLTVVKSAQDLPEGQFEAILSTEDLDNHGEKVSISGLQIPKTKKIRMYWNHDKWGQVLPIGTWKKIWKKDGKLFGLGQIDLEDEFAVKVYKKIKAEIIDSISIGFKALEYDTTNDMWTKSILTEASVVSEPANESALITQKSLGFSEEEFEKLAKEKAEKPVVEEGSDNDSEITTAIEELKSRIGAVEQAQIAATESPAIKNKIQVRLAAKQVDKAAEVLNQLIKVTLKGK